MHKNNTQKNMWSNTREKVLANYLE